VTKFIRKNLHVHIGEDDIESAYTISARSRAEQATSSPSSRQVPLVVMVRFFVETCVTALSKTVAC